MIRRLPIAAYVPNAAQIGRRSAFFLKQKRAIPFSREDEHCPWKFISLSHFIHIRYNGIYKKFRRG
jgi:hypothetical protein